MTGREAAWMCRLIAEEYGDLVEVSVTTRRVWGMDRCQVQAVHKLLGRRMSLASVEEWPSVKEVWAVLLEEVGAW